MTDVLSMRLVLQKVLVFLFKAAIKIRIRSQEGHNCHETVFGVHGK